MAGGVRYRVFFLSSSLQIDLSFLPHGKFRATDEGFRPLFGSPKPPSKPIQLDVDYVIGMGLLYALHTRSALARGRLWQTAMMLDDLRNQIVALACLHHDLNLWSGRDPSRARSLTEPLKILGKTAR